MQLNTTIIRHKRFSTYGWKLMENGVYKNTLNQGEIGVLLGHKYLDENNVEKVESITAANTGKELNEVLEVRLGTQDNQYFFHSMLLSSYGGVDYSIRQYKNRLAFPSFGNENQLYIAQDTNTVYRWDDNKVNYFECSSSKQEPTPGSNW